MKSIDVKSLLIGFLLSTTFFVTVAATSNIHIGKYQLSGAKNEIYMIDTRSGKLYQYSPHFYPTGKWKVVTNKFD